MGLTKLLTGSALVQLMGYAAALSVFASFCMTTMAPLRAVALLSNVLFIFYGFFGRLYPVLVLHLALLPVNLWRITQVLRLIGVTNRDPEVFDFAVLRPLMTRRTLRAGDVLFRRGDHANEMYVVEDGEVAIQERGLIRGAGTVIGEMGVLSPARRRTATAVALTDCTLRVLTSARLRELYFQYPALTLHLLETLADRLLPQAEEAPPPNLAGLETQATMGPHSPQQ